MLSIAHVYNRIVEAKNPIPLPDGLAEEVARWLGEAYANAVAASFGQSGRISKRLFEQNLKSEGFNQFLFERPFKNGDYKRPLTVFMEIHKSPVSRWDIVQGGSHYSQGQSAFFTLQVAEPPNYTKASFEKYGIWQHLKDKVYKEALEVTQHELTHATEYKKTENPRAYYTDKSVYYNSMKEIRAYGRNMYEDTKRRTLQFLEEGHQPSQEFFQMMYKTTLYSQPDIARYVTDKKRRGMLINYIHQGYLAAIEEFHNAQ